MKNQSEINRIINDFVVDYPPELDEMEVSRIGVHLNALLKSPVFLNFTSVEDFYIHFSNHLMEILPNLEGVIIFTLNEERGDYNLNVGGRVEIDAIKAPFNDFLPLRAVSFAGKPIHLLSGKHSIVDQVLKSLKTESVAVYPVRIDNAFKGAFAFTSKGDHIFAPIEIKLLWNLSFYGDLFFRITESSKSLVYYALYDPLTSLFNRRVFNDRIEQEVLKSRRTGKSSTVLILDIDDFKAYNDRYHHTFGDLALQEVSEILKDSVREVDIVARLGGDEFGIVLPATSSNESLVVVGRILEKVCDHIFYDDTYQRNQKMTMSIGAAVYPQDAYNAKDLVQKADAALFTAKKLGGNRFVRNEDLIMMRIGAGPVEQEIQPQSLFEAVRTVFNFEKFMSVLLHISMDSVMADRGSFFVKDVEEPEYILLAKRGFSTDGNNKAKKIYGGEIIKRIVLDGRPFLYDEGVNTEIGEFLKKEGFYNESFISLPLKNNGDVIGVLSFSNKRGGGKFTPEDIEKISPMLDSVSDVLDEGIRFKKTLKSFGEISISTMTKAFEIKYPFYKDHSEEVANLCVTLGQKVGLDRRQLDQLRTAALVHDVGMICVPAVIMNKKDTLKESEKHFVRKHPYIGWKMLENVPEFDDVRNIVLYHHERADGSGYPFGLKGKEIPIQAGVLAISEFYASVTSPRPFRNAMTKDEAVKLLNDYAGSYFDGLLVENLVSMVQ
jgi:diguanylate cyclase (GGDEF)-like protein